MIRAQVRSDQLAQIAELASNGQVEVHVQTVLLAPREIGVQLLDEQRIKEFVRAQGKRLGR